MIPPAAEIASSLYGAWRLARLDKTALQFFNRSVEGFWRSFFAAVIVLPAHAALMFGQVADSEMTAGPLEFAAVQGLIYVLGWTVFPLVMFHLAEVMQRSGEYIGYVVASNWASVLEAAFYLAVSGVAASGLVPEAVGNFLKLGAFFAILAFEGFIAATALRIGAMAAGGIVLLSLFIAYVIEAVGLSMIS